MNVKSLFKAMLPVALGVFVGTMAAAQANKMLANKQAEE